MSRSSRTWESRPYNEPPANTQRRGFKGTVQCLLLISPWCQHSLCFLTSLSAHLGGIQLSPTDTHCAHLSRTCMCMCLQPLVSPRTINIILGVVLGVVLIAFAVREVTRPRGVKSKGPLMPFLALTSTSDEVGDNYEDDDQLLVST